MTQQYSVYSTSGWEIGWSVVECLYRGSTRVKHRELGVRTIVARREVSLCQGDIHVRVYLEGSRTDNRLLSIKYSSILDQYYNEGHLGSGSV